MGAPLAHPRRRPHGRGRLRHRLRPARGHGLRAMGRGGTRGRRGGPVARCRQPPARPGCRGRPPRRPGGAAARPGPGRVQEDRLDPARAAGGRARRHPRGPAPAHGRGLRDPGAGLPGDRPHHRGRADPGRGPAARGDRALAPGPHLPDRRASRDAGDGAGSPARRSRSPPCGPAARPCARRFTPPRRLSPSPCSTRWTTTTSPGSRGRASPSTRPASPGSAAPGLAHALAAADAPSPAPARAVASGPGGTLVVVGSLAAVSAPRPASWRPSRGCATSGGARLAHRGGRGERRRWCEAIAARLAVGDDVLVEVAMARRPISPSGLASRPRSARSSPRPRPISAPWWRPAARRGGGLLARFGVDGLALVDEIEPGVSLGGRGASACRSSPRPSLRQREDTLLRADHHLRAIRHEGSPT